MAESNIESRVAVLERDVLYLKDGHMEMKSILKGLESLPYDVRNIGHKIDVLIDDGKEYKTRLTAIESAPKEDRRKPEKKVFLGLERNQMLDLIKWGVTITLIILGIYAEMHGVKVAPIVGGV